MSALRKAFCLGVALGALAPAWANPVQPQNWKIETNSTVVAAKAGIYSISVSVRDANGKPVENARVSLHIPSFGRPGYQVVDTIRSKHGIYWTTVRLHPDYQSPRDVTAVVESAT